ncbi:MAG: VWA domain-containing protein [candidate division WOR-3 bacterium]
MSFLYPQFLWLLSLASVPVILHLLSRIRLKRVDFSALYFLKDTKRERFSWFKLKEILLLVSRTLIVAFLFLALARPNCHKRFLPLKKQAQRAIIIDDSYSMGYGHQFEQAKHTAKRILSDLSWGSEVTILTTSQSQGSYKGKNLKLASNFIDSLSVSYFGSDLENSLIQAQADLAETQLALREIFIISDLQKRAFLPILQNFQLKFPTYVIDIGQNQTNCAVTTIFFSEQFPQATRPAKVGTKIKNYSENEIIQKVTLNLNDKIETKQIKIAKKEEKTLWFDTEIGASGNYFGSVRIEPDSLPIDDQRYFVLAVPEKIPVLLVYSQIPEIYYLQRALSPTEDNTFNVIVTDEKGFRQKNLNHFAVVGIINPVNFTRTDWQRLDYYKQKGGKVFIALGGEPKDRTGLEPFIDYEIQLAVTGFVSIEMIQSDHPIFEIFSGIDLSRAKFFRWSKVNPKRAKILARFSDGSPFLLESNDHNCIIATTNFDLIATDLVFKPIFLPLIQRIFFYLARGDFKTEYEVGSTITTEIQPPGLVSIKTPKETYSIMPEIIGERKVVRLERINEPGIYQIGEKIFAVNVNYQESDLQRVNAKELAKAGFKFLSSTASAVTDLSNLFIIITFLALTVEMLLLIL